MGAYYHLWTDQRNIGMKVSWHYTEGRQGNLQPDYKFKEHNKHFIRLANVVHQNLFNSELHELRKSIKEEKKVEADCSVGELGSNIESLIIDKFGNISQDSVYKDNITEESLERAARIYFASAFCPDIEAENETHTYYRDLFVNEMFSLETVLKTLARILFVANEKKLTDHYKLAKSLFNRMTDMMNLQYRDIAVLTTSQTELRTYQELVQYKPRPLASPDSDIEKLINHPVHISDDESLTSFIPFCFVGEDLIGRKSAKFKDPVCNVFTEKVVSGRSCYEANLNKYKKEMVNWAEAEQIGLSFIIDTNDEYDVKNLMERESTEEKEELYLYSSSYKKTNDEEEFEVLLDTISKYLLLDLP